MTTLYGIKNCDTVKRARKWLEREKIDYQFHDIRSDGLTASDIKSWLKVVPAEQLLNKRSTTWKQLPEATKQSLEPSPIAAKLTPVLLEHPTLIKRPVLKLAKDNVAVGFSADNYRAIFNS